MPRSIQASCTFEKDGKSYSVYGTVWPYRGGWSYENPPDEGSVDIDTIEDENGDEVGDIFTNEEYQKMEDDLYHAAINDFEEDEPDLDRD